MNRRHALLLVTLAALAVGAFWPIEHARAPRVGRALADAAHLPVFGLLTLVLVQAFPTPTPGSRRSLLSAMGIAASTALVIELLQAFVARTPSLRDLAVGWLGIGLAGAVVASYRRGGLRERCLVGAACALASALALVPAWMEWRAWVYQQRSFPSIGDFEHAFAERPWIARAGDGQAPSRIRASAEGAASGALSLRIETARGSWGGVEYEGGPSDWSGFDGLSFAVSNPGASFELNVRLEEACRCREPRALTLPMPVDSGENRLRVALDRLPPTADGRPLDLTHIERLALFTGAAQPPRVWYLDAVQLDPAGPPQSR